MKHLNLEQYSAAEKVANQIVMDVKTRIYDQRLLLDEAIDNELITSIHANTILIVIQQLSKSLLP